MLYLLAINIYYNVDALKRNARSFIHYNNMNDNLNRTNIKYKS